LLQSQRAAGRMQRPHAPAPAGVCGRRKPVAAPCLAPRAPLPIATHHLLLHLLRRGDVLAEPALALGGVHLVWECSRRVRAQQPRSATRARARRPHVLPLTAHWRGKGPVACNPDPHLHAARPAAAGGRGQHGQPVATESGVSRRGSEAPENRFDHCDHSLAAAAAAICGAERAGAADNLHPVLLQKALLRAQEKNPAIFDCSSVWRERGRGQCSSFGAGSTIAQCALPRAAPAHATGTLQAPPQPAKVGLPAFATAPRLC
jgi:hypothetical protein